MRLLLPALLSFESSSPVPTTLISASSLPGLGVGCWTRYFHLVPCLSVMLTVPLPPPQ